MQQLKNALHYMDAACTSLPIDDMPNFREVQPIPLHEPDMAQWSLRDLLFSGQLVLNYEGTPFVDMVAKWDRQGPLHEFLDPQNEHLFRLILSWKRICYKTPQDLAFFPQFPLRLKIDRHCQFSVE